MSDTTPDRLSEPTIKVMIWKPSVFRNLAVDIVEKILLEPWRIWPDEISLDSLNLADRNAVGITWRQLSRAGIIRQTGNYRKSNADGRKGSIVFEYELKSRSRAETFLKRNGRTVIEPQQQTLALMT